MSTTEQFMRLILDYRKRNGVTERAFSRTIHVSEGTVYQWRTRGLTQLPAREHIEEVARQIGIPYETVLRAAMADTGYTQDDVRHLPEWDGVQGHAARTVLSDADRRQAEIRKGTDTPTDG